MAPAITSVRLGEYTPTTIAFAREGLESGPNVLNTVRIPISLRTGPTYFIAGLKCGANINPIPTSSTHFSTTSGSAEILTPSASSTSPAPLFEEMERFPCFATLTPVELTTNAAVVDILNELDASPPVPTISRTSIPSLLSAVA